MKNILKTLCLCCSTLFCLVTISSCQNEDSEDIVLSSEEGQDSNQEKLIVTIADGLYDNWNIGDAVMLLHDGETVSVEVQESGNASQLSGTIDGVFTDDNPLYGVYPANNAVSSNREGVTVSIPARITVFPCHRWWYKTKISNVGREKG